MGEVPFFRNILLQDYSTVDLCLIGAVVLLFFMQLYLYVIYYGRIYRHRQPKHHGEAVQPVSVVLIVRNNIEWVEQTLPLLLTQEHEQFEIIVVDMGENVDLTNTLHSMSTVYPHLTTTRFRYDPKFPISNKMAYNIGIKAAQYPNIILTTSNAYPASNKWIASMAEAFTHSEVVLGYSGVEVGTKGFVSRMARSTQLMTNIRFAASTLKGRPYKGNIANLGFKRDLYFTHKGFNYLNMNIGENDLFIQKIATPTNCSLVCNCHAKMISCIYGGNSEWRSSRKFYGYAEKFYPKRVKATISTELLSRALFYILSVATIILAPIAFKLIATLLIIIRMTTVLIVMRKICHKVGEKNLLATYPIHDLIAPFDMLMQTIQRSVSPAKGIWR